jgi:hypothetical protein
VGAVVALLGTLCALSGADIPVSDRDSLEVARRRVEKMSDGERVRIRKNYQTFRALPREQQDQLLALHADVQADPRLQLTMTRYYDWFATLDAGQHDDLRNARSNAQKLTRVKSFRKAQADERSSQDWAEFGPMARVAKQVPTLTEQELDEVVSILETALLQNNLKSEEKSKLAALTRAPRQRQGLVLGYVIDREIEKDHLRGPAQPLAPDLAKKLIDAAGSKLELPRPKGFIEMPWMPKMLLFTLLAKSLDEQLKSPPPTLSELEKLFSDELSGSERDEIMRLRPEEGQRRLADQFREAHPELYPLDAVRRYRESIRHLPSARPREIRPIPGDTTSDRRPDERKPGSGGGPFRPGIRPGQDR